MEITMELWKMLKLHVKEKAVAIHFIRKHSFNLVQAFV